MGGPGPGQSALGHRVAWEREALDGAPGQVALDRRLLLPPAVILRARHRLPVELVGRCTAQHSTSHETLDSTRIASVTTSSTLYYEYITLH